MCACWLLCTFFPWLSMFVRRNVDLGCLSASVYFGYTCVRALFYTSFVDPRSSTFVCVTPTLLVYVCACLIFFTSVVSHLCVCVILYIGSRSSTCVCLILFISGLCVSRVCNTFDTGDFSSLFLFSIY